MSAWIDAYIDTKSPFSFLAKDPARQLERDFFCELRFLPFEFPMEEAFGLPGKRGKYHDNKLRYAYLDARRFANSRSPPLTILGPKRAFDSTLANAALLYAAQAGGSKVQAAYMDMVFTRFFRREMDIERIEEVLSALEEAAKSAAPLPAGLDPRSFALAFLPFIGQKEDATAGAVKVATGSEAEKQLAAIREKAEKEGVFGVPSFVVRVQGEEKGELFFGNDRVEWVALKLAKAGLLRPGAKPRLPAAL